MFHIHPFTITHFPTPMYLHLFCPHPTAYLYDIFSLFLFPFKSHIWNRFFLFSLSVPILMTDLLHTAWYSLISCWKLHNFVFVSELHTIALCIYTTSSWSIYLYLVFESFIVSRLLSTVVNRGVDICFQFNIFCVWMIVARKWYHYIIWKFCFYVLERSPYWFPWMLNQPIFLPTVGEGFFLTTAPPTLALFRL